MVDENREPDRQPYRSGWQLVWSWAADYFGVRLPVSGVRRGALLEWLAWAFGALVLSLVLSQQSVVVAVVIGGIVAVLCAGTYGPKGIFQGWAAGFGGTLLASSILGWLAWPLRLVLLPALAATLARHAAPDGRPAYRHVSLWVRSQLHEIGWLPAPAASDVAGDWAPFVWMAPDEGHPLLHFGRIGGPARLVFARAVVVTAGRGRLIVRPAHGHQLRPGEWVTEVLELNEGQVAEVRP